MKIALLDPFPALVHTAEQEFLKRCHAVVRASGHEAVTAATSDDLYDYEPDFVLVTHELAPKLTKHFTVGVLWSPQIFFGDDAEKQSCIRSWDLIVPANQALRQFASDLHFPYRHQTAISDNVLFPTAPVSVDIGIGTARRRSLAYVGVHWDGARHHDLLRLLSTMVELHIYGPPDAWKDFPDAYRGLIPFDGSALFSKLHSHGAVLALHKQTHVAGNTPSMRPFEACSAKCLVITDPLPALKNIFRETFYYVDTETPTAELAAQIRDVLMHVNTHRDATLDTIAKSHELFAREASLEVLLGRVISEVQSKTFGHSLRKSITQPSLTVIVRCRTGASDAPLKCIEALATQGVPDLHVVLSLNSDDPRFDDVMLKGFVEKNWHKCVRPPLSGKSPLWLCLADLKTEYFSVIDESCELFAGELAEMLQLLGMDRNLKAVYSGEVRYHESRPEKQSARLFGKAGHVVSENRDIAPSDYWDLSSFVAGTCDLPSVFVASCDLLQSYIMDDPQLEWLETEYLLLLLATATPFASSGRISSTRSASTRPEGILKFERDRIYRRLKDAPFVRPPTAEKPAVASAANPSRSEERGFVQRFLKTTLGRRAG